MTPEDAQLWLDSEPTIRLRERYARDLAALQAEIIDMATREGKLDEAIHAKAGEAKRLASVLRDITEGDRL